MKLLLFVASALLILSLSMTCQKKAVPFEEGIPSITNDTVSYTPTDRADVPPPPGTPWWTLDTSDLDVCQSRLWGYLKTMYPVGEENYWDYDIYAIMGEPEDVFEHRDLVGRYTYFFNDTIYSYKGMLNDPLMPCAAIDTIFFLKALGPPTCISQHVTGLQTTYFYSFKMRWRRGPCPYIFDEGKPFEYRCDTQHLNYGALLMIKFLRQEGGKMHYISFYGPGG